MQWYYSDKSIQQGPVSREELIAMVADGRLGAQELVWREGMTQWTRFSEVSELREGIARGIPPLPAQSPVNPYAPPLTHSPAALAPGSVPSNLWQSIVITLFCCLPFGIVAIVYAAKVEGLLARGDLAGAQRAAKSSQTWCNVSLVIGLIIIALSLFTGH